MKIGPIHTLGVMEGRLLPKYMGRYQAHPLGYWEDEFALAAERGLDYIEFILDYNDAESNPLMTESGVIAVQKMVEESGVAVRSVCADYFMEAPLHSADAAVASRSKWVLETLIEHAALTGISDIVIPCVDQSSLRGEDDKKRFVDVLLSLQNLYEKFGIHMSLETDLNPTDFANLLALLPSKNVTVNYDTGNSASLGYRVAEEFAAYGARISDIHIKDRVLGGGSVELGTGDTDFEAFFQELGKLNYRGLFVMQAFRDDEGLAIFDKQLQWLKNTTEKLHKTT